MSQNTIRAYAALEKNQPLERYDYDAGELGLDEVEVSVDYCGICHSDLSILDSEWGASKYPVVAGHEIVGRVARMGAAVKGLTIGQLVGVGWTAESCQHCHTCMAGMENMCAETISTIAGGLSQGAAKQHMGGFADKVRAQWQWVIPLPHNIDIASAGPLLCGGITVFTPLLQHGIDASKKVGVIGIGGLGHLALKFFSAWGCEVTAFSSNTEKYDEIYNMGANHIINSRDDDALTTASGSLDMIVSTVNVSLNWGLYLNMLKPHGKLHFVGAVLKPVSLPVFGLIGNSRVVSGSPTGSPSQLRTMVDFAARKNIQPNVQMFPMSQINEAIQHLRDGKARYRVVLKADFA